MKRRFFLRPFCAALAGSLLLLCAACQPATKDALTAAPEVSLAAPDLPPPPDASSSASGEETGDAEPSSSDAPSTPDGPAAPALPQSVLDACRGSGVRVLAEDKYKDAAQTAEKLLSALAPAARELGMTVEVDVYEDRVDGRSYEERVAAASVGYDLLYAANRPTTRLELVASSGEEKAYLYLLSAAGMLYTVARPELTLSDVCPLSAADSRRLAVFLQGFYTGGFYDALDVCYVNEDFFKAHSAEIAALPASGGYYLPEDLVDRGFWTLDFFAELSEMLKGSGVSLLTHNADEGMTAVDLLFAGCGARLCGLPDCDLNAFGLCYAEEILSAKSAIDGTGNTAIVEKLSALFKNIPASNESRRDAFAAGNAAVAPDSFGARAGYLSAGFAVRVMPLPLFSHDDFDENDATRGYRTTFCASGEFFTDSSFADGCGSDLYLVCRPDGGKLPDNTAKVLGLLTYAAYLSEQTVRDALDADLAASADLALCAARTDLLQALSCGVGRAELFEALYKSFVRGSAPSLTLKAAKNAHNNALNAYLSRAKEYIFSTAYAGPVEV